jgi:para-nitrobenzyl esterase
VAAASGREDDDGSTLAHSGAVVVTINYRLGVLGWLSHPALTAESPHHSSGNYGLLDQIAALQWIRRNIAQFGGDPGNVTIFGQSSGGEYIGCLLVSPVARGLFQHAILQSGVPLQLLPSVHHPGGEVESAEALGVAFAKSLGAGDGPAAIKKLRSIPAEQLIDPNISHDTVVDGWILPTQPLLMFARAQGADIPVIIGCTEREFGNLIASVPDKSSDAFRAWLRRSFGPIADDLLRMYPVPSSGDATQAFIRAKSDLEMIAPARSLAQTLHRTNKNVCLYEVTWTFSSKGGQQWGTFHAIDLLLLFDSPQVPRDQTGDALARAMRRYWVQFAATGDPNRSDLPTWPTYDSANGSCLDLGAKIRSAARLHEGAFELMDRLYASRLRIMRY